VDHLWAPWRMSYVTAEKPENCIFCDKPAQSDEEALILHRGELVYIMLNTFPYNTGHLLVAPYRHLGDPLDMTPQESGELLYNLRIAMETLCLAMRPEGFNIGANIGACSGAGIAEHMHVHVVPRWGGDTNFMAVAAQTRIVPEALGETHRKLKEALQQRNA
jgi:ATP adenylyltransferase